MVRQNEKFSQVALATCLRAASLRVLLASVCSPTQAKPAKLRDIADTVAANPILTQFAKMIQGSGLGTFLSSRGPFTLFVPTDSAFSKLPPGMLDTLLQPENQIRLEDILLFHVINGKKLTAKDLLLLKNVLSCEGDPPTPLDFKTSHSGTQYVMKAKIIHADIKCANGIIHEIDTVLMPPETSLPPLVTAAEIAPAGRDSADERTAGQSHCRDKCAFRRDQRRARDSRGARRRAGLIAALIR